MHLHRNIVGAHQLWRRLLPRTESSTVVGAGVAGAVGADAGGGGAAAARPV